MGRGGYYSGEQLIKEAESCAVGLPASKDARNARLLYGNQPRGTFPPIVNMGSGLSASQFPVVYNDGLQDRVTGLLPLAPTTTWAAFQQQLMLWLGLPAGSFQVMLACSRASDHEQVQKIPVHEATNFSVLLTRHNPHTDSNAHFIVQPKVGTKLHILQPTVQRREVHEEEAVSRGSSASSSPRYAGGHMAQVAAAMAASGSHLSGRPTSATMQSYFRAQQQRQRQHQASIGQQSLGHSVAVQSAASVLAIPSHTGSRFMGVTGCGTPPRPNHGPQRHSPLAPHASASAHHGPGLQEQPQSNKFAVVAARLHQSESPACSQQQQQQQQQQQRTGYGGYLQLLPTISDQAEGRHAGNYLSMRPAMSEPWLIASNKAASFCSTTPSSSPLPSPTPATPPTPWAPNCVRTFPLGAQSAAAEQHCDSMESDNRRLSSGDHIVDGYKGPSPFGPIGPAHVQLGLQRRSSTVNKNKWNATD